MGTCSSAASDTYSCLLVSTACVTYTPETALTSSSRSSEADQTSLLSSSISHPHSAARRVRHQPIYLFSSLPTRWLCLHGDGLVYHFYIFLSCICLFIYEYVAFRCHPPFLLRHSSANLGESDGPRQWLLRTCTTTLVCEVPWRDVEACKCPQMTISTASNQISSVPLRWFVAGKGCMYLLSSRCPPRNIRPCGVPDFVSQALHKVCAPLVDLRCAPLAQVRSDLNTHKPATIRSCSSPPLFPLNKGVLFLWRWAGDYLFIYIYMVRCSCSWL